MKNFAVKVDNFVVKNPEAKQHSLYPKIVENIKASSLNFTFTIDTTDGATIDFQF